MCNAAAPTDEEPFQLKHMALRNALYHEARERFLATISRWLHFIVILGGSGNVAAFVYSVPDLPTVLGLFITAIGAFQLVFNYTDGAYRHRGMKSRYYALLAEMEKEEPSETQIMEWRTRLLLISGDEPPTLRALDAIADNQATSALLGSKKPRLTISWMQSATCQFLAYNGAIFPETSGWRDKN